MGHKNVLEVLRDRATHRLDAVAQQLATLHHEHQHAVQQQQLLYHYQKDYQLLLSHESQGGIYAYRRENYHSFLETVANALVAQSTALNTLEQQQQQLLGDWQQSRKKLNALQVLIERRAQRDTLCDFRAQQKANDEFANRRFQGAE
ncbi:flagellar export protein FliJ [Rosenbergiella australiborealis]|uniref:Flagellar FliJ protein n=1 Tax=Rosenbergiella australiborealis TaxID=1544696 RepID=A0ABS5T7J6_9GAMM|nr:flagellar export protein FliJ [Rosenbergiella australiborealis]MBT0728314.1 flagellar export protein FliJ [Rosenbergiella australiborealis]